MESRFLHLQNQKIERYREILNERRELHIQMHKMPTIRVLENNKDNDKKMGILKPLTASTRK